MKKAMLIAILFHLCLCGAAAAIAAEESGCIRCHTDEAMLKSLFVPPKIAAGEGEG